MASLPVSCMPTVAGIAAASLLAAILFFPLILFIMELRRLPSGTKKSPPSPPSLPIIGNLHQLILRPRLHRTLQALAARHGPLMLLRLGRTPLLVVSSAAAARAVLRTYDHAFCDRPRLAAGVRLMYGCRDLALAPYGEYWRRVRRVCVLHLLSARRVRADRAIREQEIAALLKKLTQKTAGSEPRSMDGVEVDVSKAVAELTNDIMFRIVLGRKYDSDESCSEDLLRIGSTSGLRDLLKEFLLLLGTFNVADYMPWLGWLNKINGLDARMDKNAVELDLALEKVLDEHIDRTEGKNGAADGNDDDSMDFVDVMHSLCGASQNNAASSDLYMDKESIKALLMNMFGAGIHTIFTVIDWAMAELMQHTEVMEKLQSEVRQIGKEKPMLDEDDIKNMDYLHVVIKEVLRLHIPVPFIPRQSIEDIQLDGYHIPKGMLVFVNVWAIARDPNQWERPQDFCPERFTKEGMDIDFCGTDFELIPFGAGRRRCPGIQFTLPIVGLVIANLLYKFDWKFSKRSKQLQLDMMEVSAGLSAPRRRSLILVMKPHC